MNEIHCLQVFIKMTIADDGKIVGRISTACSQNVQRSVTAVSLISDSITNMWL
jgi:hypothetical protein